LALACTAGAFLQLNNATAHKEATMELLTAELRAQLPALYALEKNPDPMVYLRLFTPDNHWTWLVTEGSPEDADFRFSGLVIGFEKEWGYFVLSELQAARGPDGLPIERDLCFESAPMGEVKKREQLKIGDEKTVGVSPTEGR
jgi:hypothetical protein